MNFTDLTPEEAAFIVRVIGNLPTESNAWPLHQKLVKQFTEQQPAPAEAQAAPSAQ